MIVLNFFMSCTDDNRNKFHLTKSSIAAYHDFLKERSFVIDRFWDLDPDEEFL